MKFLFLSILFSFNLAAGPVTKTTPATIRSAPSTRLETRGRVFTRQVTYNAVIGALRRAYMAKLNNSFFRSNSKQGENQVLPITIQFL